MCWGPSGSSLVPGGQTTGDGADPERQSGRKVLTRHHRSSKLDPRHSQGATRAHQWKRSSRRAPPKLAMRRQSAKGCMLLAGATRAPKRMQGARKVPPERQRMRGTRRVPPGRQRMRGARKAPPGRQRMRGARKAPPGRQRMRDARIGHQSGKGERGSGVLAGHHHSAKAEAWRLQGATRVKADARRHESASMVPRGHTAEDQVP